MTGSTGSARGGVALHFTAVSTTVGLLDSVLDTFDPALGGS